MIFKSYDDSSTVRMRNGKPWSGFWFNPGSYRQVVGLQVNRYDLVRSNDIRWR